MTSSCTWWCWRTVCDVASLHYYVLTCDTAVSCCCCCWHAVMTTSWNHQRGVDWRWHLCCSNNFSSGDGPLDHIHCHTNNQHSLTCHPRYSVKVSSDWHENYIIYSIILYYLLYIIYYQLSHVWDKFLHTHDRHRKSVLMKTSDVKSKRR